MDTMTSQPPMISYNQRAEPGEVRVKPVERRPAEKVLKALTWAILSVVLAIWAVIGAVFWIPLMIRAMLRFSINLIEAAFEGRRPAAAAKVLRDAVSFYRRGFLVAIEAVMGDSMDRGEVEATTENRLLLEVLWAILVWYFLFLFLGWIQASPADLWDWFSSIPWGDHLGDLVQRFRG